MSGDDDERDSGGWWPEGEREPTEGRGRREEEPPTRRVPRGLASPDAPKPAGRYSYFVGLAFVAILVIALLNLLGDDDAGILGVTQDRGLPLAEFAAPDALGTSDADANVFQDDCGSSRNPCPSDQQRVPACEIDASDAIRVCDLFDKPLAISFWFTKGGDCLPTQDAFDAVASKYRGRVNFLSVDVHSDRETVAGIVRDRGWSVPVGLDPDGAVSNLYRVGLCPTIVLAYPGGILDEAKAEGGNYDEADISGFVDQLIADSKARAATSR
jgi:thiol-disulfide isomerase/thioredoxin